MDLFPVSWLKRIILKTRSRALILITLIFAASLLAQFPAHALAQDADDNFNNGDPCRGDPVNPIHFQVYPGSGTPGSSFLLSGKPHDSKTVGPGSGVDLTWAEQPAATFAPKVDKSGNFIGVITVPADFAPGQHILMYAEASPYTQCLEYTVTDKPQETATAAALPGTNLLFGIISLIANLLGAA